MVPPVSFKENNKAQNGLTTENNKIAELETEPLKVSNREEDSMNKEPSMSGQQIVGLIIPPPDIRSENFINHKHIFGLKNRFYNGTIFHDNRRQKIISCIENSYLRTRIFNFNFCPF